MRAKYANPKSKLDFQISLPSAACLAAPPSMAQAMHCSSSLRLVMACVSAAACVAADLLQTSRAQPSGWETGFRERLPSGLIWFGACNCLLGERKLCFEEKIRSTVLPAHSIKYIFHCKLRLHQTLSYLYNILTHIWLRLHGIVIGKQEKCKTTRRFHVLISTITGRSRTHHMFR